MTKRTRQASWLAAALIPGLLLTVGLLRPSGAHAQSLVSEVETAHQAAMENYDLADYASARDLLQGAVKNLEANKQTNTPIAARTHLLLGIVLGLGLKDDKKAIEHFEVALRIDAAIGLPSPYAVQTVQALFDKARGNVVPPEPTEHDCDTLLGVAHKSTGGGQAGADLAISARVGSGLKAASVVVLFKSQRDAAYAEAPLSKVGDCDYQGVVPGDRITAGAAVYYVIAQNQAGKTLAGKGSASNPFRVSITAAPEPLGGGGKTVQGNKARVASAEDEIPDELQGARKPRGGGCAGCVANPSSNLQPNGDGGGSLGVLVLLGCVLVMRRRFL